MRASARQHRQVFWPRKPAQRLNDRSPLISALDRQARGRPGQVLPRPGGGAGRRGPERRRAASRTTTSGRARRVGGGSARRRASSGLRGDVGADALRRVLDGLDPRDGVELRTSSSRARVAGFDLTFSAPKSVSVLFGLGDDELQRAGSRGARRRGARGGRVSRAVGRGGSARARRRDRRGGVRAASPRRSGIGRRGPAIRSCTRTSWSRTSGAGSTGGGRRSTAGGCTRTRGRRASSTRRCCAAS